MAYTNSLAKVGRGTIVSIGPLASATGTPVYIPIGEVDNGSFGGGKWETADVTNFNSGVNQEFVSTIRDNGTIPLGGNLLDADPGQLALQAAYNTGSKYLFQVQLAVGPGETTTGTLYSFAALVESFFDITISLKEAIKFKATLKISGGITTVVGG